MVYKYIILNSMFCWATVHSETVEWIELMFLTCAIFNVYLTRGMPRIKMLVGFGCNYSLKKIVLYFS